MWTIEDARDCKRALDAAQHLIEICPRDGAGLATNLEIAGRIDSFLDRAEKILETE